MKIIIFMKKDASDRTCAQTDEWHDMNLEDHVWNKNNEID